MSQKVKFLMRGDTYTFKLAGKCMIVTIVSDKINMALISYLPLSRIYVRIPIFIVHKSLVSVWFFYRTKNSNEIHKISEDHVMI